MRNPWAVPTKRQQTACQQAPRCRGGSRSWSGAAHCATRAPKSASRVLTAAWMHHQLSCLTIISSDYFFSPFKTNFHCARFRFLASSRGMGTHATTCIVQLSTAFLSRERKITASDWCTSATPPSNYRGRRWLTRWSWQQRIKVALKRSRWFISSLFFCVRASESKHLVEGRGERVPNVKKWAMNRRERKKRIGNEGPEMMRV